jgi:hypothetical protein
MLQSRGSLCTGNKLQPSTYFLVQSRAHCPKSFFDPCPKIPESFLLSPSLEQLKELLFQVFAAYSFTNTTTKREGPYKSLKSDLLACFDTCDQVGNPSPVATRHPVHVVHDEDRPPLSRGLWFLHLLLPLACRQTMRRGISAPDCLEAFVNKTSLSIRDLALSIFFFVVSCRSDKRYNGI